MLQRTPDLARNEIARLCNLTEPAVSRITRELVDAQIIEEVESDPAPSRRGRPVIGLRLRGDGAYVAAINLSADSQWVCIANLKGELIAKHSLSLKDVANPITVVTCAANEIKKLIQASEIPLPRLAGVGVSVAGPVDTNEGMLLESPNLGWPTVPLASMIETVLNIPAKIESRPIALLLAEKYSLKNQKIDNAALILPTLGIGGAIMTDGRILRGQSYRAGQIGHLTMSESTLVCTCGKIGCLDTLASGHAILEQLNVISRDRRKPRHQVEHAKLLEEAIALAKTGNDNAIQILFAAGQHLGKALKSLTTVSDPEIIFLAGQLGRSESYSMGVRKSFSENSAIPILSSKMTYEEAAVSLALRAFIYSPKFDISGYLTD
ncbi:hypothetical protein W822_12435 [Advenella kashmirensis W13003]|uniref:ROK family transcriptional regulator n=2 Tax=Advenella kashmirensis TaxID=310575 RepID=V8QRS6_9BURK|nr:hypothetical protein W822_12435 [Advenella kashmirensis W13003]